MKQTTVGIIGAGLAGLCCARRLIAQGIDCTVFEASDRVGGRVATDRRDGFLLDRGFQVFLTSYPEARNVLDYDALGLAAFTSGALVHCGGSNRRVVDAWRHPLRALGTVFSPVLPLRDIPRVFALRRAALRPDQRQAIAPELTAADYLAGLGFSELAMQRFLRPFFGGVTLDATLSVPARYFLFLFEMFTRGSATLPRDGMQAIPEQIAAALPSGTVRLAAAVRAVSGGVIELHDGERVAAQHVVIATDADRAAPLVDGRFEPPATNATTTVYYGAERSELGEPILLLNGDGTGLVNHVCFPSDVQPSYAPSGAALASVSILGLPEPDDRALDAAVRKQLRGWFGDAVGRWQLLRIDRVRGALPRIGNADGSGIRQIAANVTICGDHLLTPSIQGAMLAGRAGAQRALRSVAG